MKVREFKDFETYSEFYENVDTDKQYEVVNIVEYGNTEQKRVCADLMTDCKSGKTALRRFFKALDGDSRFEGWGEQIIGAYGEGWTKDIETYDGVYTGGYHWEIEDCDGSYYVELTVVV